MDVTPFETIEDLRTGFAELVAANGAVTQHRQSLKSVLDDVYRIHARNEVVSANDRSVDDHFS